jgi:hypothetical protein
MMTDARTKAAGSECATDIGVKTRHDLELTQLANLDAFHLWHGRKENVGALLVRQVHSGHPKVLPFQPQLLASTSLKLRYMRSGGTRNDWVSKAQTFCES